MKIGLALFVSVLLRRNNGLTDYVAEFVSFIQQFLHPMFWESFRLYYQANPATRFAQLLQTYSKFMNKVGSTFRGTGFLVVWCGRCATSQKLARDMPAHPSIRESVNNLPHSRCEVD